MNKIKRTRYWTKEDEGLPLDVEEGDEFDEDK
jgi:hypothetical protein